MHGYSRSTHNLSRAWRSSAAAGPLIPFLREISLPGDSWDIDLDTIVRTMPTNGPIFGQFKLQLDIFEIPIRLYVSRLHNNELGVGMEMEKVLLPMMEILAKNPRPELGDMNQQQINSSSLLHYLGIRGLGKSTDPSEFQTVRRQFNCLFLQAYNDTYKNYYANKQEEIGFVIESTANREAGIVTRIERHIQNDPTTSFMEVEDGEDQMAINRGETLVIRGTNLTTTSVKLYIRTGNFESPNITAMTIEEMAEMFESVEILSDNVISLVGGRIVTGKQEFLPG